MSTAAIAIIAENIVILVVIAGGWSLLRQGGGIQVKAPVAPKKTTEPPGSQSLDERRNT